MTEWRRGWRIVAGAGVGLGTGILLYLMVMSLFVEQLTREFGWSRADMGIAAAVAFGTGALALPVVGRLVDRFGFRPVALVCTPALALGYLMMSMQRGSFPIYLAVMAWGGLAGSGTGAVVYTRPVIAAFERRRGLALGLATAGTSVMGMIVPPLLAAVIAAYGWRAGLYTMAALTALVGPPLALTLIGKSDASDARIADADGSRIGAAAARGFAATRHATLAEAVRGARFWLLVTGLVTVNLGSSGVIGHLAPLLGDKGLSDQAAALVLSTFSAGLLAGRLMTGFSLDRWPAAPVAAVMTLVPAAGMGLLLIPNASFAVTAVAGLLIGLQQGSEVDLIAYFVSRGFGVRHYSAIYGAIAVAGAVSTAFAFVFFGRVRDLTGAYTIALASGAAAYCVGAAAFVAIGLLRDDAPAAACVNPRATLLQE